MGTLEPNSPAIPDHARCGYALRDLDTPRCPECGLGFDPTDQRTMNLGVQSALGRFLLRPTGWFPILFCCLGAIGLLSISRWPLTRSHLYVGEFLYYMDWHDIRDHVTTVTDLVYVLAVLLFISGLGFLTLRFLGRLVAQRHYRQSPDRPVHLGRRAALVTLASLTTAMTTLLAWPYRVAKIWARLYYAQRTSPLRTYIQVGGPPITLSAAQAAEVLRTGVLQLDTVKERTSTLSLLIEKHWEISKPIVLDAIAIEKDPRLKATEIRLLGLYRDTDVLPTLLPLLDDADPLIRASAIDAIGIIHQPAFPIPNLVYTFLMPPELIIDPPVRLSNFPACTGHWGKPPVVQRMPDDLRSWLWQIALHGAKTSTEREAAANAVKMNQASSSFRVAEWGVWIAATDGSYHLAKSVIDEIPPFVHQTGDRLQTLSPYLSAPDDITKPIIHITADRPMVVDIAVRITDGRPLYAYPLPDDYCVASGDPIPGLANMTDSSMATLPDPRTGYKWISPPHDTASSGGVGGWPIFINSIGLRWQTIIVSPEKLSWMQPPDVPNDPKYAWWTDLRKVPSSWVCSRGESERFLYYDGATVFPPSWIASI